MRHRAFPAAIGLTLAAALFCVSSLPAEAASPYGYWRKAKQGEHPAKMQVYRCGRSLCVKIAWLQNPNDSKGRPLRDVRNSSTGLRGRAIQGLHIVRGMQPVKANQWKGSIYNPEDGNTYSATLTMVSSNKIILKGCKAFLLCGERIWLRTSAPPKEEPKPEPQIEASAEPAPAAAFASAAGGTAPRTPKSKPDAFADAEMLTPAAKTGTQAGYRFLNGSQAAGAPEGFSGENVPSMFAMTTPIEGTDAPASPAAKPAPPPQPKPQAAVPAPKPKPPAPAAAKPKPQPAPRPAPATQAQPAPLPSPAPEPVETAETEAPAPAPTAAAAAADEPQLTWRERRQIRRQERARQSQGFFPWAR